MSGNGPRTIGSFTIERELGSGGMGVVLLGRHQSLERPAVLKRLRPDLAASEELVERFAREARAAGSIHHQNVVAVYDWISWRGEHYIAQEYVDGVDLRAALALAQRFPWRIAALVGLELARGLEAIHARGMVHRDLKPANVLLGRNGDVKIADFGIAIDATSDGLTRPGTTVGSPPYIAPEQLLGERVDARGDLFCLGVVLDALLTGAPPFRVPEEGETDSLLTRIQRERFEPIRRASPTTPRWLARLVRSLVRASRARGRSPRSASGACSSHACARSRPRRSSSSRAGCGRRRVPPARGRHGRPLLRRSRAALSPPPRSRARLGRGLVCAVSIGSFAAVPGVSPRELVTRALASHSGAAGSARVSFATDQRLRLAIDAEPASAIEPGDERELAPGRHRLSFEWPSGAHASVELELAPGERRTVRPERPAGNDAQPGKHL